MSSILSEDTPVLSETIRKFIVDKRTAKGWSQKDLAVALYGDSRYQSYISDVESGKRDLKVNTLEKFLSALGAYIIVMEK